MILLLWNSHLIFPGIKWISHEHNVRSAFVWNIFIFSILFLFILRKLAWKHCHIEYSLRVITFIGPHIHVNDHLQTVSVTDNNRRLLSTLIRMNASDHIIYNGLIASVPLLCKMELAIRLTHFHLNCRRESLSHWKWKAILQSYKLHNASTLLSELLFRFVEFIFFVWIFFLSSKTVCLVFVEFKWFFFSLRFREYFLFSYFIVYIKQNAECLHFTINV